MVSYVQSIPAELLNTGAAGTVLTSGATNDFSQATWSAGAAVPVGAVIAWLKSLSGTPALSGDYVECNGQTLSDSDSVYDGVVIPDLNGSSGDQRFLRGNTTSGTTGGADSLTITHTKVAAPNDFAGSSPTDAYDDHTVDPKPPFYTCVWVMRIK